MCQPMGSFLHFALFGAHNAPSPNPHYPPGCFIRALVTGIKFCDLTKVHCIYFKEFFGVILVMCFDS